MKADALQTALREHLQQPPSGRVVLLTGPWGSGKTFLWKQGIAASLERPQIYVSAFGAERVETLKSSLLAQMTLLLLRPLAGRPESKLTAKLREWREKSSRPFAVVTSSLNSVASALLRRADLDPAELTDLLPKETIFCIDDLERAAMLPDKTLAFANYLAEHKGFDVVLICNEDLIADKEAYHRAKEKTVYRTLKLEPSINLILDRLYSALPLTVHAELEAVKGRDVISDVFITSRSASVRTLKRILEMIISWRRAELPAMSGQQVRLLAAVALDYVMNHKRRPEFYEFSAAALSLSQRLAKKDTDSSEQEEANERLAFAERFFHSKDFAPDRAITEFVLFDELSTETRSRLLAPAAQSTLASLVLLEARLGSWRFQNSDAVRALLARLVGVVLGPEPVPARELIELLAWARILSENLNDQPPPTVEIAVRRRFDEEEVSSSDALPFDWKAEYWNLSKYVTAEIEYYEKAHEQKRATALAREMMAALDIGDVERLGRYLTLDPPVNARAFVAAGGLDALFAKQSSNGYLFVIAIQGLQKVLREGRGLWPEAEAVRTELKGRLEALRDDSGADPMARWRAKSLLPQDGE